MKKCKTVTLNIPYGLEKYFGQSGKSNSILYRTCNYLYMQSLNVFHAAISRRYNNNNNNLNKTVECKGKGIECGWRRGGGEGSRRMCDVSGQLNLVSAWTRQREGLHVCLSSVVGRFKHRLR